MRTVTFRVGHKRLSFNGLAGAAVALLQVLAADSSREGLKKQVISARLAEQGILFKAADEDAALANLLQRLVSFGVIKHPNIQGGKWRYSLKRLPKVEFLSL